MPFVFEGVNMSLKIRNKISLRPLNQQQLVNHGNKIPFPNTFCNLNFQFKYPDRLNLLPHSVPVFKHYLVSKLIKLRTLGFL